MESTEKKENFYLPDSATTHTTLCGNHFFSSVTLRKANVHRMLGPVEIIDCSRNTIIVLPNCTTLHIEDALLSGRLKRNLLNFKVVHYNGYHLETVNEQNKECLYINSYKMAQNTILEKFEALVMELYCVFILAIKSYSTMFW